MVGLKEGSSDFIARGANLTRYYAIDEYVSAKVINVSSQMLVDVTTIGPGLRKLKGGQIIQVGCKKVPRIIGKQGSMVSLIKDATGCQIVVGQNGRVWINGEPIAQVIAIETIHKIASEAHTSGLTDVIKTFLEEKTKGLNLVKEFKDDGNRDNFNNNSNPNNFHREERQGDF
jgi:exosome complex component RRP4